MAGVRAPSATQARLNVPTYADVTELVEASGDDRALKLAILLAAGCGLRRGEALGLTWSAVDLKARTIQVRQAVVNDGASVSFAAPKTDKGIRTIPLPPQVVAALEELPGIGDALVISEGGKPIHPDLLSTRFRRAAKRAGVACRYHDLRHRFGTTLHEQGVPIAEASAAMGHSTPVIYLTTYVHATPTTAISAAIGQAMEGGS